jgi:hypothetical protein
MRKSKMKKVEGMHDYLAGFDKFNVSIPIYVNKPFTDEQVGGLRAIIEEARSTRPLASIQSETDQKEFISLDRFDPRIMTHMSRMVLEFECTKEAEAVMDSYVLPMYKEEIKLGHYSYLDYNLKYGENEYFPSLPPHIDAANTLVTFNYCLDTNIDWEIYVDNVSYDLKKGDALIFSAVNQVHWRPKREWAEGDFCEIISFDYTLPTDWRFEQNGEDPIDPRLNKERREAYMTDLKTRKEFTDAWNLYNKLGLELNIDENTHGKIKNGTATDNN